MAYSLITFTLFVLFIDFSEVLGSERSKIIDTKQGKVEGYLSSNGMYYEYCGIKYGVVKDRYKAPEDPPSHEGVFTADNRFVLCPQFPANDALAAPSDNQDCLVLNIYVPTFCNTTLPVMVFLHGGDFGVGSSSPVFYGPHYLVSHGVIVISVNYRLNALGFLNLGIKDAPGNAGLKDIRAALRWVKENIKNFGGDDENVTVFGNGSGGVAAICLTLSDSCKGLFKRIISESGSLFTPKSFDANPLATASQVAKSLGVKTMDPAELLNIYTDVPINKLEEAIGNQMNAKSVFLPSVEEYLDDEPFLCDTPFNIITSDDFEAVPAIFGLNTVEGLTSTLDYYTITSQIDRIMNEDFSVLDQKSFNVSKEDKFEIREILKDTYFANISSEENIVGGLINMNSDFCYVGPMSLFVELYSNSSDVSVYQYIFNHMGYRNLGRLLTNTSLPATTNMDELFYLFELERLPLPMSEDDARIVTFMTMMWTNFAKYGTPTPEAANGEWLPYPHNLAITLEPQYVAPLTPERAVFWRSMYFKYGAEIEREN
ncbi:acetylcholinesterase-like [Helicoverpa zea]|uniref:acetylcholinesterase-like n=1 Tax=Helicoverpa zea TaxID=7113 RepID=UPI001F598BF7|nr:acetylcholinesterase-like [Helicoverpa zea]